MRTRPKSIRFTVEPAKPKPIRFTAIIEKPRRRSRSKFSGMKLRKLVDKNPRRPNTHGARHWKLYREGMTYEQLASKPGFGYHHFRWDLGHQFIRMR